MSANPYQTACEYAANEITEIDAQIDRLTRRKETIGRLLELFEQLNPEHDSVESPAADSVPLDLEVLAHEVADQQLPEFQAVPQSASE